MRTLWPHRALCPPGTLTTTSRPPRGAVAPIPAPRAPTRVPVWSPVWHAPHTLEAASPRWPPRRGPVYDAAARSFHTDRCCCAQLAQTPTVPSLARPTPTPPHSSPTPHPPLSPSTLTYFAPLRSSRAHSWGTFTSPPFFHPPTPLPLSPPSSHPQPSDTHFFPCTVFHFPTYLPPLSPHLACSKSALSPLSPVFAPKPQQCRRPLRLPPSVRPLPPLSPCALPPPPPPPPLAGGRPTPPPLPAAPPPPPPRRAPLCPTGELVGLLPTSWPPPLHPHPRWWWRSSGKEAPPPLRLPPLP